MTTSIEWTDETWNPLKARANLSGRVGWHCEIVSPGCVNCYAQQRNKGFFNLGTQLPYNRSARKCVQVLLDEGTLTQPLRWKRPRRVFVSSMTDLFGEWHTDEMIDRVFAVMALAPQHQFQVLTKRAERMREYLSRPIEAGRKVAIGDSAIWTHSASWPLPNVWLGVSVEDQKRADERIPLLLQTPAAVRFVSAEPLLGGLDIAPFIRCQYCKGRGWYLERFADNHGTPCKYCIENARKFGLDPSPRQYVRQLATLDWVIVGGESGPGARPFDLQWGRDIIGQCKAAEVPVFMKQLGARPILSPQDQIQMVSAGLVDSGRRDTKGGDPEEWPAELRVREFPEVNR